MMILRINMRAFFLMFLLASIEVQARILLERNHNSMVESIYGRLSTPKISSDSTLESSPSDVLSMKTKKAILQTTLSSFTCVTESFCKGFNAIVTFSGKRTLSPPPPPKVAPPTHYVARSGPAASYESPPNPFLASS